MKRSGLLAYLVGAAVAGSLLVFPYVGRPVIALFVPGIAAVSVPFFLLPVVWGLWNGLHVRVAPTIDIGAWGSALGFVLGLAVNVYLYTQHAWFGGAVVLPILLAILYFLLWRYVVGPLNAGVDPGPRP